MPIRFALLLPLMVVVISSPSWAQDSNLGPEFQVNTYTTGSQMCPSVAMDDAGNFVIAWDSYGQDGEGGGVFAQRFDAYGTPLGGEFQVNTYTTNHQRWPAVAMDGEGNFIITWHSDEQDGESGGIFAQRFDAYGTPLGGEFQVNTYTVGWQALPSVAMDGEGNFVIAWDSDGQDEDGDGIFAQRFDASGTPLGGEFQVNTRTIGSQASPSVAMDYAGNFVIAWASGGGYDGDGSGIFAQRYDAPGTPVGQEFQVNTRTIGNQAYPSVAMDYAGNFVIAWYGYGQYGEGYEIFAQLFDSYGAPVGPELEVNTCVTGLQMWPEVTMNDAGNFVIAWQSLGQDGDDYGVFAQLFDASGTPVGQEFRVNPYTIGQQEDPALALDDQGNLVVAWSSYGQDGDREGIFARLGVFGGYEPSLLSGDVQLRVARANVRRGKFIVIAWFRPSPDGDGIDPSSEDVSVELFGAGGFTFSETIEAGEITKSGRGQIYTFTNWWGSEVTNLKFIERRNGVWALTLRAEQVDCSDWSFPVTLRLTIGNDYGEDSL